MNIYFAENLHLNTFNFLRILPLLNILNVLGIVSDHSTQLFLSMLGAIKAGHLLGKLPLEVLMGALKGLLAPKSKTLVLALSLQELLHVVSPECEPKISIF